MDPELTPRERRLLILVGLCLTVWILAWKMVGAKVDADTEPVQEVVKPAAVMELPDTCGIVWEETRDERIYCWRKPEGER